MPTTPQLAVTIFILCIYRKNVEPVLSLVPRVKAFALPRMSKRATLIQRQYNVKSHATFKMTIKRA